MAFLRGFDTLRPSLFTSLSSEVPYSSAPIHIEEIADESQSMPYMNCEDMPHHPAESAGFVLLYHSLFLAPDARQYWPVLFSSCNTPWISSLSSSRHLLPFQHPMSHHHAAPDVRKLISSFRAFTKTVPHTFHACLPLVIDNWNMYSIFAPFLFHKKKVGTARNIIGIGVFFIFAPALYYYYQQSIFAIRNCGWDHWNSLVFAPQILFQNASSNVIGCAPFPVKFHRPPGSWYTPDVSSPGNISCAPHKKENEKEFCRDF